MLEVYTYNAGKGDCIRIHFAESHNIFIDTGVTAFAHEFKRICDEIISMGETLDVLILTHVDDDHIGGILANLRQKKYRCPFREVWMNHSGSVTTGDRNLSVRQNNEVYSIFFQQGTVIHSVVRGGKRTVAGAVIEIIWPEELSTSRNIRDTTLARRSDYGFTLSELAEKPIRVHDSSQSNKDSIVFSFAYEGHRLLFTGDAWAEDVVKAEGTYDLVKLPHHGSVRNISDSYPDSIQAHNFLICTDGVSHPDKQTIAKLEKWYGEIKIYSPSVWWGRGFLQPGDEEHSIEYYKREGLVIAW